MPRFTVLGFTTENGEQLGIEPVRTDADPRPQPPGITILGEVQVPLSTRLVELSPPTLLVPGYGRILVEDLIAERVVVPAVVWVPAGQDEEELPPE